MNGKLLLVAQSKDNIPGIVPIVCTLWRSKFTGGLEAAMVKHNRCSARYVVINDLCHLGP
jgi:hypothetical protein